MVVFWKHFLSKGRTLCNSNRCVHSFMLHISAVLSLCWTSPACRFSLNAFVCALLIVTTKSGHFTFGCCSADALVWYGSSQQDLVCADQQFHGVCVGCAGPVIPLFEGEGGIKSREQKILFKISVHINILWKILCVQLPFSAAWPLTGGLWFRT